MWEQIQPMVADLISSATVALTGLAAAYAALYIRRATAKINAETVRIQDNEQRESIWHATQRLQDVAELTVAKIEQTVAGELRQAVKDGKVDRAELLALGKRAYNEVLATVEPEVVKVLQENLGDLKTYLESSIETQIKHVKEDNAGKLLHQVVK
jgi:hypothetical protein